MRLLIDGVFFQLASSGIARVWQSLIPYLVADSDIEVMILDRGDLPSLPGATRIPFPAYKDLYTADDSALIQRICDFYDVDVFTSTYYTTPLTTPMVLIVYDMIPELFDFDLGHRHWQEKALAIAYARRFVCISDNTRADLVRLYPHTDPHATFAWLGYDAATFRPLPRDEVAAIRDKLNYRRPYMLLVGSREQHRGYKNSKLFFDAVAATGRDDFDILCVGGEPVVDPALVAGLPSGMRVERVALADDDLARAYNGAVALVYPSLYEGFGLPVVEAMACGCPVITTARGSLAEVAGDACLLVEGTSTAEMAAAIEAVQTPSVRADLKARGLARAELFDWATMAARIAAVLRSVEGLGQRSDYREFASAWRTMRLHQSEVDVDTWR